MTIEGLLEFRWKVRNDVNHREVIIFGIMNFFRLDIPNVKNLYLDVFRDEKELLVGLDGHVAFDNEGVLKVKNKIILLVKSIY